MEHLNIFAISGVLITATTIVMVLLMVVWIRSRTHVIWGLFCVSVMLWGFASYRIGIADDAASAVFWWRFGYIGVIFIPVLFMHFVHDFVGLKSKLARAFLLTCYGISGAYLALDIFSDVFIRNVRFMFDGLYFLDPTPTYHSFLTFFTALVVYSHILLFLAYRHATGQRRTQLRYFFIATSIGFAGGGLTFLPHYGINLYPYSNIFVAFYPVIMGYASLRHRLFNIDLVAAHAFTLLVLNFSVIRFVLSLGTNQAFLDGIILAIVTGLAVMLIKSVVHEVRQREQLRELSEDLSYATERLQALDRLKSQFLSFASHQLRAPLAAVRWQAQLIAAGTFGKIPKKAAEAAARIDRSLDELTTLVNEFLDLRKLEEGRMEFAMERVDIAVLTRHVVDALAGLAKRKGLSLSITVDARQSIVLADEQKFRQVIQNLVENAIKYTDVGSVTVTVKDDAHGNVIISVTDTGHGIESDIIPTLFDQFMRGPDETKLIEGTGLGLYIAKQIVTAHKGTIWAESFGRGKGSSFSVRMPSAPDTSPNRP